jgi:hypothetical protein
MADPLDSLGLDLPYDYSKGEAPGAPAAAPVKTQAAPTPAPAPNTSHPELDNIPVPYDATKGESPGAPTGPPAPPKTWGDTASDLWHNTILGQNQPPIVLQPRSLSQAGTDVSNFGRVFADQAGVPGAVDWARTILPGAGDIDYQRAQTKKAEEDIGPVASGVARFMGQRASVNRIGGELGVPYANSPVAQGAVTGGFGTLFHGGNWTDALANAAADTGLSALGEAAGTAGSAAAKKIFDRSTQAVSGASSAALEDLHDLWRRGGDVAGQAEQYANSASGAAKDAYRRIADAANQSTAAGPLQRLGAAAIGSYLPGVGPLASAYIADPAIQAYNRFSKGLDVTHAIHEAYPAVVGAVKSIVDPQAWRSALQSVAVSQGPTGSGTLNAVRNFSPTSWTKALWPGSQ